MRILIISTTFPYPPTLGGTEVRTFNLMRFLKQQGHQVTLVTQRQGWTESPTASPDQTVAALRQTVDEVAVFPLPPSPPERSGLVGKLEKGARFLWSFVQAIPPYLTQRRSLAMQTWINDRVRGGNFDAITCEHSVNTIYIQPDFFKYARIVVNVHSSMYGAMLDALNTGATDNSQRDQFYLSTVYRYEKKYCNQPYQLVVTTPDDRTLLQQFNAQAEIAVIPNGVDLDLFPYRARDPGGQHLIFVGAMDITHNIDAAVFFALEVFPIVQDRYPQAQFSIVGGNPIEKIQRLGDRPGIVVTGRVPSMVDYLHQATVCVVPLRTGYGIKNKTLEAMAAGVPVVGSDRGLEGLTVSEGSTLRALRANTVPEYGDAITRLLESAPLRSALSAAARTYVEQDFTWAEAGSRYESVLGKVL